MPQVSVRDSRGSRDDRPWIESRYRDYLTDLSPDATGLFPVLGEIGHREPDLLERWYRDPSAHVLTVVYGDERVGFAMVNRPSRAAAPAEFTLAEFFISRPWRRRGIGGEAVRLVLDRFTGHWLITEDLRNDTAVRFWRRVVGAYTGGSYQERIVNGEVHQRFESGPRRPR